MLDRQVREVLDRAAPMLARGDLETLLTSEDGFGLTTATPLQRAICRSIDGLPLGELWTEDGVASAFGGVPPPAGRPKEVAVVSGTRGGKSLTTTAVAVQASQRCDMSFVRKGEIPRVSVVGTSTDIAEVILEQHLKPALLSKPALRLLLADEPKADSVLLKHPSGRVVEIKVVAGARAGASLVARWSAGVIFDEAPRMLSGEEGVVNLEDARAAVRGRLLPGAQILYPGSPWEPTGFIWEMVLKHFGKPSRMFVIIKAPGPLLNPYWWTKERQDDLKEADPDAYVTDVLAEFANPEANMFPAILVEAAMREKPGHLPYDRTLGYVAAMDPATRSNAWTLVVGTLEGGKLKVAYHHEWQGSSQKPLSPRGTLREIAAICKAYGLGWVYTDQYSVDANRELADDVGLSLVEEQSTARENVELYMNLRARFAEGAVELPQDLQMRADLVSVKKKTIRNGIQIVLPVTARGRHCDYAPSLVRALSQWIASPVPTRVSNLDPIEEAEVKLAELEEREAAGYDIEDFESRAEDWN